MSEEVLDMDLLNKKTKRSTKSKLLIQARYYRLII